MSSPAVLQYESIRDGALTILKVGRRGFLRQDVRSLYGGVLVGQVAAWNAYIVHLVRCFLAETAVARSTSYSSMRSLVQKSTEMQLERFNTPNSMNTRNLLILGTGYDPWTDWQWKRGRMSGVMVRQRLDEILKVRHSLAHGFQMPGYSWTESPSGEHRLTLAMLLWTRAFLDHLVWATDKGMKSHLTRSFDVVPQW